jgi:hypothetical protein
MLIELAIYAFVAIVVLGHVLLAGGERRRRHELPQMSLSLAH